MSAGPGPSPERPSPEHPSPPLRGLLIAGGHGRRAGGPKALRQVGDDLAWRMQARALLAAGCDEVVAVLHPDAWLKAWTTLADPSATPGVRCVAADPDAPMFASVQRGLTVMADGADAADVRWALLPVDCPMPGAAVLRALRDAADGDEDAAKSRDDDGWWVARPFVATAHGPRFGHPLLLAPVAAAALRAMDATETRLDRWIAGLDAAARLDVEVADAGILANHNGPASGAGAAAAPRA